MNPREFVEQGLQFAAEIVARQQAIEVFWLTIVTILATSLLAWVIIGGYRTKRTDLDKFEVHAIIGIVSSILGVVILICLYSISVWLFNPEFAIIDALFE